MPTGLHPGAYDDQPAADLTFWLGVMSLEASTREQFEAKRQRQSKPKMRRR